MTEGRKGRRKKRRPEHKPYLPDNFLRIDSARAFKAEAGEMRAGKEVRGRRRWTGRRKEG